MAARASKKQVQSKYEANIKQVSQKQSAHAQLGAQLCLCSSGNVMAQSPWTVLVYICCPLKSVPI